MTIQALSAVRAALSEVSSGGLVVSPETLAMAAGAALAQEAVRGGLAAVAGSAATALSEALGADAARAGRLEAAALEFGREVRALAVGELDRSPDAVAETVATSLETGADAARKLPSFGFDQVDRAAFTLEQAATELRSQRLT